MNKMTDYWGYGNNLVPSWTVFVSDEDATPQEFLSGGQHDITRSGTGKVLYVTHWSDQLFSFGRGGYNYQSETNNDPQLPLPSDIWNLKVWNSAVSKELVNHGKNGTGTFQYTWWLWKGYINIPETRRYTFIGGADDRFAFRLNGEVVLATTGSYSQVGKDLTAGIAYFEAVFADGQPGKNASIDGSCQLAWHIPSALQYIPLLVGGCTHIFLQLDAQSGTVMLSTSDFDYHFHRSRAQALKKAFWPHKIHFGNQEKSVSDAHIGDTLLVGSLDWFTDADPGTPFNNDKAAGNWLMGYMFVPTDGVYTFGIDSDDAGELCIDDQVVVAWYGEHGMSGDISKHQGSIALNANTSYKFDCRLSDKTGKIDGIALGWKTPGSTAWAAVPPYVLTPREEDLFPVGLLDGLTKAHKAAAAYAVCRLFGWYAGPQVRIRRESDNLEKDIWFDKLGNVQRIGGHGSAILAFKYGNDDGTPGVFANLSAAQIEERYPAHVSIHMAPLSWLPQMMVARPSSHGHHPPFAQQTIWWWLVEEVVDLTGQVEVVREVFCKGKPRSQLLTLLQWPLVQGGQVVQQTKLKEPMGRTLPLGHTWRLGVVVEGTKTAKI